ncbi:MAG: 4a-hydroxytetrahydrobiopterin dehydratase [Hormoscilla sp. SP5CHS1]|nr:4a-hydroxytetrahydrobiopterin dehydratase [Hormoscilla sp. SP12CHS1]MBC6452131.1 4a-hydroxytetrahydrobiopterin dehydratase [Hormoscilla sp. SP5CHS1]
MSELLSEASIKEKISSLTDWDKIGKSLRRTKKLENFVEAIAFVNKLVEPAEVANHHPDISISYNKVTINLTTHDAGGLTQKDFDLAKVISQIE